MTSDKEFEVCSDSDYYQIEQGMEEIFAKMRKQWDDISQGIEPSDSQVESET